MNTDYSLVSIISNNPELSQILAKKVDEVKKHKQSLSKAAEEVSETYKEEIIKGTKKKALLLTDGVKKGMSEEEVMKDYGRFIPTVRTPILNLLYYILRETEKDVESLVSNYNKDYGHLKDDESLSENMNNIPEMEKYLFDNCDYDTFSKIKKLKKLMESPHEGESLLAYKKCRELCDKHNLDFDKIK